MQLSAYDERLFLIKEIKQLTLLRLIAKNEIRKDRFVDSDLDNGKYQTIVQHDLVALDDLKKSLEWCSAYCESDWQFNERELRFESLSDATLYVLLLKNI